MSESSGNDSQTEEDEGDGIRPTQEQIDATNLSHNIAVTAGAGTGKTTTLTRRYLRMLSEAEVTPKNIVTITFTKDAALEMRERIRAAVDDELTAADDQPSYDRWRDIRDELEDGYIHTIHAFCSRLLREHAVEAPVEPNFSVLDETDAAALQREVVKRYIDDHQDDRDIKLLARLWSRDELEEVLVGLLDSRPKSKRWATHWADATPDEYLDEAWQRFVPIDGPTVEEWFSDPAFVEALETCRDLASRELAIDEGDSALAKLLEIDSILDRTGAIEEQADVRSRQTAVNAIADTLTTGSGDRYSRPHHYHGANGNGWPAYEAERDRLSAAMETLLETIEPETRFIVDDLSTERNSSHYVLALARRYRDLEATYAATKDDRGAVDYSDLIETTIRFLIEHDEARAAVQEQFDYVMVDEVQDTDPRQLQLVQALTGNDPRRFDSQNVFLVGDEKQSIYRFRGADVTAFGEARRKLTDANPAGTTADLPLTGNFRTVELTLEFLNDLFEAVLQPEGDNWEPFEAEPQRLTAERTQGTAVPGSCEYLLVPESSGSGLLPSSHPLEANAFINTAHREATALGARLTTLFDDPPTVYDEDDGEYRPATPADVTVLLRARTRLSFYERAFDDVDIPYTVVSGTGFYDVPEITTLVNLFRVLEDPQNDIALYGVLRSPLFGLTDDRLASAYTSSDSDSLWDAIAEGDGELGDARALLTGWRHASGLGTDAAASVSQWSSLLTRIIDETGFLAAVSADDRPQQAVVNVEQFREKLRNWEDQRALTISELLDRIDRQRELAKRTPEATIHTASEGVEIRTVHSAKGLENRIIVVPELDVGFNQRANVDDYGKVYLEAVDDVPFLGLKAPTGADTFVQKDTLVRERLKERHRREDRAEQKRLLYVALTRARDHLLMSGTNKLAVEGGDVFPKGATPDDASSWRDFVEPVLFDDIDLGQLIDQSTIGGETASSSYTIRLPPEPVDWEGLESRSPETAPALNSGTPPRPTQPIQLSATEFAKIAGGYVDDVEFDVGEPSPAPAAEDEPETEATEPDDRAAFGDAVHRLCELRRPESEWGQIVEQTYREHDIDPGEADRDRIGEHARRGIDAVDDLHDGLADPLVYTELFVRATVDTGRVIGFVDHLAVTDDAYYIVDFKTSETTDRTPAEIAERYWPQLEAYALALCQHDPRPVSATLYFTDAAQAEERLIEPTDVPAIEDGILAAIARTTQ